MVIIEQCERCLTLRRGEQTLELPRAAAAQQLAAALSQLGVTARRTTRADHHAAPSQLEETDDQQHA